MTVRKHSLWVFETLALDPFRSAKIVTRSTAGTNVFKNTDDFLNLFKTNIIVKTVVFDDRFDSLQSHITFTFYNLPGIQFQPGNVTCSSSLARA